MRQLLAALCASLAAAQTATIAVDWSKALRPLQTVVAFQTVVNPVVGGGRGRRKRVR